VYARDRYLRSNNDLMNIETYIDHTILRPTTTAEDVRNLCAEAMQHNFAAVCVPPPFVNNAKRLLRSTITNVATVIGFPFGYSVAAAKVVESEKAIEDGADELDIVINLSALKSGSWSYLESEMKKLKQSIHSKGKIIKVIIESGVLSDEEIIKCCEIYSAIGVDYLKTSTGYAEKGATLEAVQLMRANLPSDIKIKASGGIKTYEMAKMYIEAGASRIGTSSGVAIVNQTV
jgi:deoxyribose-phosphate aldolase